MNKKSGLELLLVDTYGLYIPQVFAENFDLTQFHGISAEDIETILAGPDGEWYWEAWHAICRDATHTDAEGNVWHLYQNGDLWMYCEELMTQEEKHEFFHADGDCDCDCADHS